MIPDLMSSLMGSLLGQVAKFTLAQFGHDTPGERISTMLKLFSILYILFYIVCYLLKKRKKYPHNSC